MFLFASMQGRGAQIPQSVTQAGSPPWQRGTGSCFRARKPRGIRHRAGKIGAVGLYGAVNDRGK